MKKLSLSAILSLVCVAAVPLSAQNVAESAVAANAAAQAPAPQQLVTPLNSPLADDTKTPWIWQKDYFRRTFGKHDNVVSLRPPVKLRDYVVGGKLELSLRNYLELVLANNTDIEIQRLNLELPKNAIERAFSFYDPQLNLSFNATRSNNPATNQLEGADVVSQLSQPFQARFNQTLATGTQLTGLFNSTKTSTNNQFQFLNPAFSGNTQFGFTHPLMRNQGYVTRLNINIARSNKRIADISFEDQLQRLLVTAEQAYWDLISARENVRVREQALTLAEESLKRARREVELGATSPLDIFQPEQQYANAKIALTQQQFRLQQTEDTLRRQMGADLDPDVRNLPISLTERVEPNADPKPIDREAMVELALQKRPDLRVVRQRSDVNDLQIRSALHNLRPQLNLTGNYTSTGRGGTQYLRQTGQPTVIVPGGIGGMFGQIFGFDFNTYAMGVTLNFPLRDRQASMNYADALINKKINALQQRQTEQNIRQETLNAVTAVEQSKASLEQAKIALDFAQKRADAEQKKYDLGVSQIFFLLQAQTDLTNAQSDVVNQTIQYRRNLLTLQQRTGTLLDEKGIVIQ